MEDGEFVERVKQELQDLKQEIGEYSEGELFEIWFARTFFPTLELGTIVEKHHIGSGGDNRLDLGIVDDTLSSKIIIQCKYRENPLEGDPFNKDLVDEVISALNRIKTAPNDGNENRKNFVVDFNNSSKPVRLIATGFGNFVKQTGNDTFQYAAQNNVEIYDFKKIKREYLTLKNPASLERPEKHTFYYNPELSYSYHLENVEGNNSIKCLMLAFPIQEIFRLISRYQNSVFEENLRYKVSTTKASSAIVNDIKNSIRIQPEVFIIKNNGLTLVCKNYETDEGNHEDLNIPTFEEEGYKKITLHEPQIVNGCQTSYAIHDYLENITEEEQRSLNSFIHSKIVQLEGTELETQEITLSTNKQNPIVPRDIYANHEFQEDIFDSFGVYENNIFYDKKAGEWNSVVQSNNQHRYRVRGQVYRKIDNSLAGQLYLSLIGLPHLAGDKKGVVFEDKYYNAIFDFHKDIPTRFVNILTSSNEIAECYVETGLSNISGDILFSYSIYSIAEIFKQLYNEKLSSSEGQVTEAMLLMINKREFMKYWSLYLVRLIRAIIVHKAGGDFAKVYEIQQMILGSDKSIFFDKRELKTKFNLDTERIRHTILNPDNPSTDFPILGKWLVALEDIVFKIVEEETRKELEWKNYNYFFYKQKATLQKIWNAVVSELGGAYGTTKFPDP